MSSEHIHMHGAAYEKALHELAVELLALRSDAARLLYICPHVRADGDALGTAVGLQGALRKLGLESRILLSEAVSGRLKYLSDWEQAVVLTSEDAVRAYDAQIRDLGYKPVVLMVDCSSPDRLGERAILLEEPEALYVLDHHISEWVNERRIVIWAEAAATCELATDLIAIWERLAGQELLDVRLATALYTGILTDTGRFTYRATSPHTLEVAARLLAQGVDTQFLSSQLFDVQSKALLRVKVLLAERMEFLAEGRAVIATINAADLQACQAGSDDLDSIPAWLRDFEGVEVSLLLRELEDGTVRGNLRSLPPLAIQPLAAHYGGGGHAQAAGFTIEGKRLGEIYPDVKDQLLALLDTATPEVEH